jgi:hypothetical protein
MLTVVHTLGEWEEGLRSTTKCEEREKKSNVERLKQRIPLQRISLQCSRAWKTEDILLQVPNNELPNLYLQ